MRENRHLVPVWIVYVDGQRLSAEVEGEVRRVRVDDRVDGIGEAEVEFGCVRGVLGRDVFRLESWVSVHMGYKDDCAPVFGGEVTELLAEFGDRGEERLRVVCRSCLHRLGYGRRSLPFERKRLSEAVRARLEANGLRGEVEDFGAVREYFAEAQESDLEFVLGAARKYGKTVYAQERTVYIKDEVTVGGDEVVLEWGKSLAGLRCRERLDGQVDAVSYVGWDERRCCAIRGNAGLGDLKVRIGGGSTWRENAKGGGCRESVVAAGDLADSEDAKKRAAGELQRTSMEYQRAVAECEGNRRVMPGMRVTVRGAGERFSGEYLAERVVHETGRDSAYTTEVYLRRNMSGNAVGRGVNTVYPEKTHTPQEVAFVGDEAEAVEYTDSIGESGNVSAIENSEQNEVVSPTVFNQNMWTTEENFKKEFAENACAATAALNAVSTQYTRETGKALTFEDGKRLMTEAINAKAVDSEHAIVNDWGKAANTMGKEIGLQGKFTVNEKDPEYKIYAFADPFGKHDEPAHFSLVTDESTNQFVDSWDGETKYWASDGMCGGIPRVEYRTCPLETDRPYRGYDYNMGTEE